MILADTSIWIDFFRSQEPAFRSLLDAERIWMHPFVMGEIACGRLRDRNENLRFMRELPEVKTVADSEAMHFLERHRLMGRGVGYIDLHLLASVAITDGLSLWTRDRRLDAAAADLELAYRAK